jgi:hypothetical protein
MTRKLLSRYAALDELPALAYAKKEGEGEASPADAESFIRQKIYPSAGLLCW